MEYIFRSCLEFIHGVKDSLKFHKVLEFVVISSTIKSLLVKVFLINGVILAGSAYLLHLVSNLSFVVSFKHWEWAKIIFTILYHLFYLYPLLIGSLLFNSFYYLDISTEALNIERNIFRNRGVRPAAPDIVTRLYNELINLLVIIFYAIQVFLLSYVPIFGFILYIFTQSFMYAFYCFTYKWGTDQVDLHRILAFFDKYFFYFSGFGFVYASITTILTQIYPSLVGTGVYAAAFPIWLLLSIKASPPKHLEIKSVGEFINHFKAIFMRNSPQRPQIEYDYIDTFNYEEARLILKNKIGIFTFPLMLIDFIRSYLAGKVNV